MAADWTPEELQLVVADYLSMLSDELSGRSVNKSRHRKQLIPLLNHRTEGSVEFKHQNISAVMVNLKVPYIKGYLPMYNFQKSLVDEVIGQLSVNRELEALFQHFADLKIAKPKVNFFEGFIVDPPVLSDLVLEPSIGYVRRFKGINYLEREQNNLSRGKSGEELVLEYEKWQLMVIGKERTVISIKWRTFRMVESSFIQ